MGKAMNWIGVALNWMAYIWLITREAYEGVLCCTMGGLVRYFLPATTRQNWRPSRLELGMHPINKPSILVSH